jgi:hypothetical protein
MAQALSIAYTATPLAAGVKIVTESTGPVSPGVNFVPRSKYKVLQVSAAAAVSPVNALAAYTAQFGALVSGQKIFLRFTPYSSGGVPGDAIEVSQTVT